MEIKFTSEITVEEIQHVGSDAVVVAAARVSTKGWDSVPDGESYGLIRYLMKHRHGSVFEHGSLTVRVHAPIFVWREWHRHRIGFAYSDYGLDADMWQSFNEESGRYRQLEPVFYLPPRDRPMMKVDDWKPGRPKFLHCESDNVFKAVCRNLRSVYGIAYDLYCDNLSLGIDPGLARGCLPVGIYSSCYVTCNPRSAMAFLSLRTHEPTARDVSYPLYEIEAAARKLEAIFASCWPLTYKAWDECGRVAP